MPLCKRYQMKEAIDATVYEQDCVGKAADLQVFDMYKIKIEDLDFLGSFQLKIDSIGKVPCRNSNCDPNKRKRRCLVTAIVSWFHVQFRPTNSTFKLDLDTRPILKDNELTHWRQTVLNLETPIEVREGDELSGRLLVQQMEHEKRALNLKLGLRRNNGIESIQQFKLR